MMIPKYITQRIKGFFARDKPQPVVFVDVVCHSCHRTVKVREGMLGQDWEQHFRTVDHGRQGW